MDQTQIAMVTEVLDAKVGDGAHDVVALASDYKQGITAFDAYLTLTLDKALYDDQIHVDTKLRMVAAHMHKIHLIKMAGSAWGMCARLP